MIKETTEILKKTYNNKILRRTTVPLFLSNPGLGKSITVKHFAESKGVKMLKLTLSQRLPMEVVGTTMPNSKTGKLEVYDSLELSNLKDGDILFLDEIFNGTLKSTLDAVLNLLEDRTLPTGKKLADIMIVAASNPQGLISLTPQIKERFIKYDLKFNAGEYQLYLKEKYGMPESISYNLCTLIGKEKFDHDNWNYVTPRSVEKAINQIGCEVKSAHDDILIPYLSQEIDCPVAVKSLNVNKGDKIKYIDILKPIVQNLIN